MTLPSPLAAGIARRVGVAAARGTKTRVYRAERFGCYAGRVSAGRLSGFNVEVAKAQRALSRICSGALDLVLPPRCPACGMDGIAHHGLLCAACFQTVSFIGAPLCTRCGVPFAAAALGPECPACRDNPPRFSRARAALRYDDGTRRLILPLKHADRVELAALLVPFMARAGAELLRDADVIVPVPLHRARLRRRKYNQAALLAQGLARCAGVAVRLDALCRTRGTAPLGGKSASERAAELTGAFAVRPTGAHRLAGRQVLLVDDVMTSGATANACVEVLMAAGARQVDVLVAARVPDPRADLAGT